MSIKGQYGCDDLCKAIRSISDSTISTSNHLPQAISEYLKALELFLSGSMYAEIVFAASILRRPPIKYPDLLAHAPLTPMFLPLSNLDLCILICVQESQESLDKPD